MVKNAIYIEFTEKLISFSYIFEWKGSGKGLERGQYPFCASSCYVCHYYLSKQLIIVIII